MPQKMNQETSAPETPSQQNIQNVGKSATQVGRDYTTSTSINVNLVLAFFFIAIVALGGIALAMNFGLNPKGDSQFIESPTEKIETENQ